jgi:hypothetical protein
MFLAVDNNDSVVFIERWDNLKALPLTI